VASSLDIASFVDRVLMDEEPAKRDHLYRLPGNDTAFGPTPTDPFTRMFGTRIGQMSAGIVGNESKTLSILSNLATEALLHGTHGGKSVDPSGSLSLGPDVNAMVVTRGWADAPPVVMMLDPNLPAGFQPRSLAWHPRLGEDSGDFTFSAIAKAADRESQPAEARQQQDVARALVDSGRPALDELFWIIRPDVVVARHPEMEPVGCPSPALEVQCTPPGKPLELSSVGLFCRDSDDVVGVTACHHGTGPVGTPVTIGGLPSTVKHADIIQDIVFIPLPDGYAMPNYARGLSGPRNNRPPFQGEPVQFEGRTTGHTTTMVSSHSPGLLWLDPLSQNKVQTPAAVNRGDSGSALVDDDDHVLGFAFRRTKFGQPLEFAEWIWAANAMAALGLASL
jgi:hypothetical protein